MKGLQGVEVDAAQVESMGSVSEQMPHYVNLRAPINTSSCTCYTLHHSDLVLQPDIFLRAALTSRRIQAVLARRFCFSLSSRLHHSIQCSV